MQEICRRTPLQVETIFSSGTSSAKQSAMIIRQFFDDDYSNRKGGALGDLSAFLVQNFDGAAIFADLRKKEGRVSELPVMVALGDDYPELREAVHKICERYPGEYWRKLEAEQAYPTEFIAELTQGGFLASLIPEEYGGSGLPLRAAAVILEEVNASGCTASQGHAQMYIMGTLLRHGSEEQKQRYLPKIASGALRLQAFGVTEPTTGSDTTLSLIHI